MALARPSGLDVRAESVPGPALPAGVVRGLRVLLERSVPIALATGAARPDLWLPALAPSLGLRRWYAEHPGEFEEFARRYEQELDRPERAGELRELLDLAAHRPLVLQAATRPAERGHAAVVARRLLRMHAAAAGLPEV